MRAFAIDRHTALLTDMARVKSGRAGGKVMIGVDPAPARVA